MAAERILVTGGAGFIGSHIVEGLLARGARVRVLDNFSSGRREFLPESARLEVLEGDLRDPAGLKRAVEGVEVVLHQAALRSVPRSIEDPVAYHDVNVTGTLNLLMAARAAGIRRLVFASSSSVYGNQPVLPLHEEMRPRPISPYGASKLAGEHYCANFALHYGVETVALRYFNVFGPRQDPKSEYAAVVPKFIEAALLGQPAEVHGDGEQVRDFTFVTNVVDANLAAAEAPGVAGQVFNVACGESISVLDIVRTIENLLGRPVAVEHTPPRPGDVRATRAEVGRARSLLRYEPAVGFEAGLRATLDYFARALGQAAT